MVTNITIKAKDGEKITGILLRTTNKNIIKEKKKDFFPVTLENAREDCGPEK